MMGVAFSITVLLWLATFYLIPPIAMMGDATSRLVFTLKCCCVVILFTFVAGIEAVAHERLRSDAFDPMAGHESHRLKVNNRYVQNTLEQLLVFLPGLFALAFYCDDGSSMRAVVATSLVWAISRIVFWIAYQIDSRYRVAGLTGMAQSMLVLLYVAARFGYEVGGLIGAIVPIALFGAVEVFLVSATRPSQEEA
jgi:hypothetical protein